MKASRLLFLGFVLCLALPAFAGRQVTIDDLMQYRNASAVELSADGSRAVFVVTQSDVDENVMRSNLYLLGASGGAIQLTNGPRHDGQPRWSPDGKWIAFISDRDRKPANAGMRQVWLISPDGGEAWQLLMGPALAVPMALDRAGLTLGGIPANAVVTRSNIQSLTGMTPDQFLTALRSFLTGLGRPFNPVDFSPGTGYLRQDLATGFQDVIRAEDPFQTPHNRTFLVGVQRALFPDLAMSFTYVHRDIRDILGVPRAGRCRAGSDGFPGLMSRHPHSRRHGGRVERGWKLRSPP